MENKEDRGPPRVPFSWQPELQASPYSAKLEASLSPSVSPGERGPGCSPEPLYLLGWPGDRARKGRLRTLQIGFTEADVDTVMGRGGVCVCVKGVEHFRMAMKAEEWGPLPLPQGMGEGCYCCWLCPGLR